MLIFVVAVGSFGSSLRRHLFGSNFQIQHLGTVDALDDSLRARGASRGPDKDLLCLCEASGNRCRMMSVLSATAKVSKSQCTF